jgi:hypothetical protein
MGDAGGGDGQPGGLDEHAGHDGGLRPIRSARWPVAIIPAAYMNGYRALM